MSTNTDTESTDITLGSRENWWGNDDPEIEPSGHVELPGVNKDTFVAKTILLSYLGAVVYCPSCFHDRDQRVPLDDPSEYVPHSRVVEEVDRDAIAGVETFIKELYGDHRQHRVCPSCGTVSWGGILADRETGVFLEIVQWFLSVCDTPESRAEALVAEAHSRKSNGWGDQSNLERVVSDLRNPSESN